ncbi:MAG: non-canonical purine NTP diphosphatase [Bacteroidales bacterium]|nr:non-canonical purine NTP diphosphatase [Bacteroidales bacterium]
MSETNNKLVFATNNKHKLEEVKQILGNKIEILSLNDINCHQDIPETADTLEGNALIKASFVSDNFHYNCFADDTGLEVEALNNAPGVYSARYAGENKNSEDNIDKLLAELNDKDNRKARFRTVISLIIDDKKYSFEGIVEGEIAKERSGNGGFGYDSVFKPNGYNKTFAELSADEKNAISHRGRAMSKLLDFLLNL